MLLFLRDLRSVSFTFTLCFSHFECFKKRYLSCSLCLGICSCSRGFGLEMPVRTSYLNAELMLPSCGLWIWGLLSALLLAGQSGACPPHCSCTGTTVDCHGLAFKTCHEIYQRTQNDCEYLLLIAHVSLYVTNVCALLCICEWHRLTLISFFGCNMIYA